MSPEVVFNIRNLRTKHIPERTWLDVVEHNELIEVIGVGSGEDTNCHNFQNRS